MLEKTQNFVVAPQSPAERTELDELLKHPKVKVLESVEDRLWKLSIPTELVSGLRARLNTLRLDKEVFYPAPPSHPAKP